MGHLEPNQDGRNPKPGGIPDSELLSGPGVGRENPRMKKGGKIDPDRSGCYNTPIHNRIGSMKF